MLIRCSCNFITNPRSVTAYRWVVVWAAPSSSP